MTSAYLGTERGGAALLAPLRALGPAADTFAIVPPAAARRAGRRPARHERAPAALAACRPGRSTRWRRPAGSTAVELRHTGGALARSAEHHGALDTLAGELCLTAAGPAAAEVVAAVDAFDTGRRYLNLVAESCDPAVAFDTENWQFLTAVKAALDPEDRFLGNHPVPVG